MPITGRTLHEAAQTFCDHLNRVLSTTVTQTRVVAFGPRGARRIQVTFRQAGQPIKAPLRTRFGQMGLYIGQVCDSVIRGGLHELRTVKYTYTLTPEGTEEPLLRWEYVKEPGPEDRWCRHHLQGNVSLPIGRETVSLNDLHLPTGYVTIEDILRFCIVDLGIEPPSINWHEILQESYERFRIEFAPGG